MSVAGLFFEDLTVGSRWTSAGYTFTEAAIQDFAFRYDPQPFHIDGEAARQSVFGGLIASGFQTLAIAYRLAYQTGVLTNNIGGRGLDEVRWPRAVRPGDTMRVTFEITSAKRSSLSDRGNVEVTYTATNQSEEVVLTARMLHVVRRRDETAAQ